jgi:hypothetical protein
MKPIDCEKCKFKSRIENGMLVQEQPKDGIFCEQCLESELNRLKCLSTPMPPELLE